MHKVSLAYGGPPLFDAITLDIRAGDRLALLGRNGTGKSSLLKVVSGEVSADSGVISRVGEPRIAVLPQDVPDALPGTVAEVVLGGCADNDVPEWEAHTRLERILPALGLDGAVACGGLSAGLKRRILLGRCLIGEPDLLLLDEPTNHLDLESITWMESALTAFRGGLLFITHDRAFLQKIATAILDLDRGLLTRWDCDYATYVTRKAEWLAGEAQRAAEFDKKLAQEEVWIRKGIQARRTRNEGRVRALQRMREVHRQRRREAGSVRLEVEQAERSGDKVVAAEDVTFSYQGAAPIIRDFTAVIRRGDRIGIVGPNGAGKSTLVRLLLGTLAPTHGRISLGTNVRVAYFDQLREQLDPALSVRDNVADGADTVEINGKRRHVIGYLGDFLFPPDRARSPVSMLSGGERNRLLLARLFTRPFNVLVLDEPTNDLDLETIELLEELLAEYQGTLLLIAHDRAFLDNVVTDLLVLEGDGRVQPFVGSYADYQTWRAAQAVTPGGKLTTSASAGRNNGALAGGAAAEARPAPTRKLLNRERRELDALPQQIEELEAEHAALVARLADPALYREGAAAVAVVEQRLTAVTTTIATCYERWAELEAISASGGG
jgi:ABC transport system ATP-binding/permease protein